MSFIWSMLFKEKPSAIDITKIKSIKGVEQDLLLPDGRLILPDSTEYFQARLAWNWSVSGTPSVVVIAKTEADVVATIKYCREKKQNMCIAGGYYALIL
jgi:FAD/FMN-containing dehydrogenase